MFNNRISLGNGFCFLFGFSVVSSIDLFRRRLREPTVRVSLLIEIRDVNAAFTLSLVNSIEVSQDSTWEKSKYI